MYWKVIAGCDVFFKKQRTGGLPPFITSTKFSILTVSHMKKLLCLIALLFSAMPLMAATDYYVAATDIGAGNGTSCANADAITGSFFTSAGNWVSDMTWHLCGKFVGAAGSTLISSRGGGTAGHPVTIKFEPGALLQSPRWGSNAAGAISISHNFVTVDGGTNGTIENTLSGDTKATCLGGPCTEHSGNSAGVFANGNNVTVKNLVVTHIYLHTEGNNDGGFGANNACIVVVSNNELVTGNTVDNCYSGIAHGTASDNVEFSFNKLTFCNHCIKSGINSGTASNYKIHDNDISSMYNWDEPDNGYHHNGIFLFADPDGCHTNAQIYNNYIHGMNSRDAVYGDTHVTGWIFVEYCATDVKIFNNVLAADPGVQNYPANGFITEGGPKDTGNHYFYNNTIAGAGRGTCINAGYNGTAVTLNIQNNICSKTGALINIGTTVMNIDHNIYATQDPFIINNAQWHDIASWRAKCNCDLHTLAPKDPQLDSSYHLIAGSPAAAVGANLTSLGISLLSADKAGVPRSASTAWDLGAYASGTSAALPSPPTGLSATVE
jgi:hypothetical protein